ncbi:hypothetical protein L2E82_13794 [Cichorium intybus]|uniref:Uncharacterized protein n=1 Tax=Cichorium intybus TaxID=13427 RepID=A0ACB9EZG8_CICIN|nr:hypothetical protein L2E82_13794 [Cichorium intybus]
MPPISFNELIVSALHAYSNSFTLKLWDSRVSSTRGTTTAQTKKSVIDLGIDMYDEAQGVHQEMQCCKGIVEAIFQHEVLFPSEGAFASHIPCTENQKEQKIRKKGGAENAPADVVPVTEPDADGSASGRGRGKDKGKGGKGKGKGGKDKGGKGKRCGGGKSGDGGSCGDGFPKDGAGGPSGGGGGASGTVRAINVNLIAPTAPDAPPPPPEGPPAPSFGKPSPHEPPSPDLPPPQRLPLPPLPLPLPLPRPRPLALPSASGSVTGTTSAGAFSACPDQDAATTANIFSNFRQSSSTPPFFRIFCSF